MGQARKVQWLRRNTELTGDSSSQHPSQVAPMLLSSSQVREITYVCAHMAGEGGGLGEDRKLLVILHIHDEAIKVLTVFV